MVTFPIRPRLKLPLAPVVAVATAIVVAAAMLAVPQHLFESIVTQSGLPTLFPAAEPPLGLTARLALMVTLGSGAAAAAWFAVWCAAGERSAGGRRGRPQRAPLRGEHDLGTPFLKAKPRPRVPEVRAIPRDLNAPLSAFDPDAIPVAPADPVPLLQPLAPTTQKLAPGERIDAFVLPTPIATQRTDATIHALLDRLERGVASRTRAAPEVEAFIAHAAGLQSALGELRRMAVSR